VPALAAAGPWRLFARNLDDQPALRVTAYAITGAIAASDNAADGRQLSQHKHSHSRSLAAATALKEGFNGDRAAVSYLNNIGTAKETTMDKEADGMSEHDEWTSYSHWGMFPLERKSSN
jgi:hypothetical protein